MKKSTIVLAILTIAAVMWVTSAARATVAPPEEKKIEVTFYGYPTQDNNLYAVGFHGKTNFPYSKIEVVEHIGNILGTIPPADPINANNGIATLTDHGVRFFSGDIEFGKNVRSRLIFSLVAYDADGNPAAYSQFFSRTPQKWVFEVWSTRTIPTGCGTACVTVTYIINELYGNVIEEGKPVQFVVNGVYYNSAVIAKDGKKFCAIQVSNEVFQEDFLGKDKSTVVLVENNTVTGYTFDYFPNWLRPAWMNLPAGTF